MVAAAELYVLHLLPLCSLIAPFDEIAVLAFLGGHVRQKSAFWDCDWVCK